MKENTEETPQSVEDSILDSADISIKAKRKSNWYLATIGLLACVVVALHFLHKLGFTETILDALQEHNYRFGWMLLTGFIAEFVVGSMGMGYGVICTTVLLFMNVPPPAISASVHSAESFTSAAGSLSHYKLRNVNLKLVKQLALPAIIGAVLGALVLTYLGKEYANYVKPFIAAYTIYLGYQILKNGLKRKKATTSAQEKKKTRVTLLGFSGGFIDSFAGGGWGPLVTGTLIKNGRTPRYAIGSSTFAKFILTIASAITFVFTIGVEHWDIVLGLLIGGVITAPFSAMLTSRLPVKKMSVIVGTLVIVLGLISIFKSF